MLLLAAGVVSATPAVAANPVQARLTAWTARHPDTSALVVRLGSADERIASHTPDVARLPASTMKIATSAGALLALGPDFRFTTRLYASADAVQQGSVLTGTLYLRGGGDPLLSTIPYSRRYLDGRGGTLGDLTGALARDRVRTVKGAIVADGTVFDSRRTGLQWRSYYSAYAPPLSGLSVNQNYDGDTRGRYAADPEVSAARRLRSLLLRRHIRLTGAARAGTTPAAAVQIGQVQSPPLSAILRVMNPESDNFIAETLRKDVGAYAGNAGTTAEGDRVTTTLLRDRGLMAEDDVLVDGSGLSRANRVSATTLVRILSAAQREPDWGTALVTSLPRGGEGTLVRRFRQAGVRHRVRAKTGYIDGVSSLAGVAVSPAGVRYAFAFLMNDTDILGAKATQDAVVALLARGGADDVPAPAVSTPTPAPTPPATTTAGR